MSGGGDFDVAGKTRIEETKKFWKNIKNVFVIDSRDIFIKDTPEDQLVNWVESHSLKIDGIMVPPKDDFHFEHRVISNVGRALTRKRKVSIIEYYTPSTSHTWAATTFVDVTDVYERKKELLKVFETQRDRNYFQDYCLDSFHTNYFCNKREQGFVEQFKIEFLFL